MNQFFVGQVAYIAERLDAIREGERSLLDNTMLLYLSSMRNGHHHVDNLPVVLLGSGGGSIEGGRVLRYGDQENRQMCRLYLSLMHRMGLEIDQFGDADQAPGRDLERVSVFLAERLCRHEQIRPFTRLRDVGCGMWDAGCGMRDVGCCCPRLTRARVVLVCSGRRVSKPRFALITIPQPLATSTIPQPLFTPHSSLLTLHSSLSPPQFTSSSSLDGSSGNGAWGSVWYQNATDAMSS